MPTQTGSEGEPATSPEVVPQQRMRTRRGLPIWLVAGLVVALIAGGSAAAALQHRAPKHTITGTLTVHSMSGCGAIGASAELARMNDLLDGKTFPCPQGPGGGYNDIALGTAVVVRSDKGTVIGTGAITDGTQTSNGVVFNFRVDDVPDEPFYGVEVAHRGAINYSRGDLARDGWKVSATLGS